MPKYKITQITDNSFDDLSPKISGSNIVWYGSDGTDHEIYLFDGTSTIQITDNTLDDTNPEISGNNLVWIAQDPALQDADPPESGSDNEIYLYNGTSTTQLTDNSVNESALKISGENIVWAASDGNDNEIYLFDGTNTTNISDNNYDDAVPEISGTNVVWEGFDGQDFEIYLFDGTNTINLSDNTVDDFLPKISGTNVVWSQSGSTSELYFFDGTNTTNISNNDTDESEYQISGNQVVWTANDGNDNEIFLYNGTSTIQLTDNENEDSEPQISGNQVVWKGYEGNSLEIFLYDGTNTTKITNDSFNDQEANLNGDEIVIWSRDDGGDREIYKAIPGENNFPTEFSLDNNTIEENNQPESIVGFFSTTDPDVGDQFTYTLVTGEGDDDNSAFSINGDQLIAVNSLDYETQNNYSIRVKTDDGFGGTLEEAFTISVLNTDESIYLTDATVSEGNSGNTYADFVVTLTNPSSIPTTVEYKTLNGSATAGSDYTGITDVLTFEPGETEKTISVEVQGDTVLEGNERFFLELSNSTGYNIVEGYGVGTISDDDQISDITISVTDLTITEGNSGTTNGDFVVSLSAESTTEVSVNYNTLNFSAAAGNDYNPVSSTLTFNPGETSLTVSVEVKGDTTLEANEAFLFNLANPVGASISDALAIGTIVNDDQVALPKIYVTDSTVTEGDSGTTAAQFVVGLSQASNSDVTVNYNTVNYSAGGASDYVAVSPTGLTFLAGETEKTISVTVRGDITVEQNERFLLNLSSPTNATINNTTAIGTILTDDTVPTPLPNISITDTTVIESDSGLTTATFTVSLSEVSEEPVTVNYRSDNNSAKSGSDYNALIASTLTFEPGELFKTISVDVRGDSTTESDEVFFVTLSTPVGGSLLDRVGVGTIINDEITPQITIADVSQEEGDSGKTPLEFVVNLSESSYKTVLVNYRTIGNTATVTTDFDGIPTTTLTFNPGETSKVISVNLRGDTTIEPNERFFVSLSTPVNSTISDSLGVGTIFNDDRFPSITIGDISVNETDSGSTTATFGVSLSQSSSSVVVVNHTTADGNAQAGSDYTSTNGVLTFSPGEISQYITVDITGDTLLEGNERFLLNLTNPVGASLVDSVGVATIYDFIPAGSQAQSVDLLSSVKTFPLESDYTNHGAGLPQSLGVFDSSPELQAIFPNHTVI